MLRSFRAWEAVRAAGELTVAYRGVQSVPKAGGRPCHVLERTCARREADGFSLDEAPPADPKRVARDGFDAVTLMLDAEALAAGGDGAETRRRALVGEYYFRDVELNPPFAAAQFTPAALKGSAP